jgi:hypothetical protein
MTLYSGTEAGQQQKLLLAALHTLVNPSNYARPIQGRGETSRSINYQLLQAHNSNSEACAQHQHCHQRLLQPSEIAPASKCPHGDCVCHTRNSGVQQ